MRGVVIVSSVAYGDGGGGVPGVLLGSPRDGAGNGENSTVAELTEAAAVAVGAPGAVPGSDEEARARLGDYFADALLLDQASSATKARTELAGPPATPGWSTSSAAAATGRNGPALTTEARSERSGPSL